MKALILLCMLGIVPATWAQVAINNTGTAPNASAMLDISSTTRGLLVPRMTMAQRNAIANPATGLMVYQTDNLPGYYFNIGTSGAPDWQKLGTLTLPYHGSSSGSLPAFSATNTGAGNAIAGISSYTTGGYVLVGVYGEAASPLGIGVDGQATNTTAGLKMGVRGVGRTDGAIGVYGLNNSETGVTYGLRGTVFSDNGFAGYFTGGKFYVQGNAGIGTTSPLYKMDVTGTLNLNKDIVSGIALRVNADEAIWYNGTYFSWGYAGDYNFFGNKLRIGGNGNLAPAYTLYVDGTAAKSSAGTAWVVSSDARLKHIQGNYNKGLQEIMGLQPVQFSYLPNNPRQLNATHSQIGFVAQDVQKLFPEAVSMAKDGYLDFDIHAVNVAVINALKELKTENDLLKARLEALEKMLETMKN